MSIITSKSKNPFYTTEQENYVEAAPSIVVYTAPRGSSTDLNATFTGSGNNPSLKLVAGGVNEAKAHNNSFTLSNLRVANVYGGVIASLTPNAANSANPQIAVIYVPGVSASLTGNTSITIESGTYTNVFGGGGGFGSKVIGNTNINYEGGTVTNIYGGGANGSVVQGNTYVNITGSPAGGRLTNIYGGGLNSTVTGSTNVKFSSDAALISFNGTVSGGGSGALAVVKGKRNLVFDNYSGSFSGTIKNFTNVQFAGATSVYMSRAQDFSMRGATYEFAINNDSIKNTSPMLVWNMPFAISNVVVSFANELSNGADLANGAEIDLIGSTNFRYATSFNTKNIKVVNDEGEQISSFIYTLGYDKYDPVKRTGGIVSIDYKGTNLVLDTTYNKKVVLTGSSEEVNIIQGAKLLAGINTAGGNDVVNIQVGAAVNGNIELGTGNNTLTIQNLASLPGTIKFAANSTNTVNINGGGASSFAGGDSTTNNTIVVNGSANGGGIGHWSQIQDVLQPYYLISRDVFTAENLNLGDSNDTVIFNRFAQVNSISLGGGNDKLVINDGAIIGGNVNLGAGNNTLVLNQDFFNTLLAGEGQNVIVAGTSLTLNGNFLNLGSTNNVLVVSNGAMVNLEGVSIGRFLAVSENEGIYLSQNAAVTIAGIQFIQNYTGDFNAAGDLEVIAAPVAIPAQVAEYYKALTDGIVKSDIIVAGDLAVNSGAKVSSSVVDVAKDAFIDGAVVSSTLNVGGDAFIDGSISGSSLEVSKTATVNGTVTASSLTGNQVIFDSPAAAFTGSVTGINAVIFNYAFSSANLTVSTEEVELAKDVIVSITTLDPSIASGFNFGDDAKLIETALNRITVVDITKATDFSAFGMTNISIRGDVTGDVTLSNNTVSLDFNIFTGDTGDFLGKIILNGANKIIVNQDIWYDWQQFVFNQGATLGFDIAAEKLLAIDGVISADPVPLIVDVTTFGQNSQLAIGSWVYIKDWNDAAAQRPYQFPANNFPQDNVASLAWQNLYVTAGAEIWGGILLNDNANELIIRDGAVVNGGTRYYDYATIRTMGGDDIVTIGKAVINGQIDTGDGADTLTLNGSTVTSAINQGVAAIEMGIGDDTLNINAGSKITGNIALGEGNDTARITDAVIAGNIDTGLGNDTLIIDPSTVTGNITLGEGNDAATIIASTITGNIDAGTGNDNVIIDALSTVNGNVLLGGGTDAATVSGTSVINGSVIFGSGDNTLNAVSGTVAGDILFGLAAAPAVNNTVNAGGIFGINGKLDMEASGANAIALGQNSALTVLGAAGINMSGSVNTVKTYGVDGFGLNTSIADISNQVSAQALSMNGVINSIDLGVRAAVTNGLVLNGAALSINAPVTMNGVENSLALLYQLAASNASNISVNGNSNIALNGNVSMTGSINDLDALINFTTMPQSTINLAGNNVALALNGNVLMTADAGKNSVTLGYTVIGAGVTANGSYTTAVNGNIVMAGIDAVNKFTINRNVTVNGAIIMGVIDINDKIAASNTLTMTDPGTFNGMSLTLTAKTNTVELLGSGTISQMFKIYGETNTFTVGAGVTINDVVKFGGIYNADQNLILKNAVNNVTINGTVSGIDTSVDLNVPAGKVNDSADTIIVAGTVSNNIVTGNGTDAVNIISGLVNGNVTMGDISADSAKGDKTLTLAAGAIKGSASLTAEINNTVVMTNSSSLGGAVSMINGTGINSATITDSAVAGSVAMTNSGAAATNVLGVNVVNAVADGASGYASGIAGDVAMTSLNANTLGIAGRVIANADNSTTAVHAKIGGKVDMNALSYTAGVLDTAVGDNSLAMGDASTITGAVTMNAGRSNTLRADTGWIMDYAGGGAHDSSQDSIARIASVAMASDNNRLAVDAGTLNITTADATGISMLQSQAGRKTVGGSNAITVDQDARLVVEDTASKVRSDVLMGNIKDVVLIDGIYDFANVTVVNDLEVYSFDWNSAIIGKVFDTTENSITVGGRMFADAVTMLADSNTIEVTGPATTDVNIGKNQYVLTTASVEFGAVDISGKTNTILVGVNPVTPINPGEAAFTSGDISMHGLVSGKVGASQTNWLEVADNALFNIGKIDMLATDLNYLNISGVQYPGIVQDTVTESLVNGDLTMVATDVGSINDATLRTTDVNGKITMWAGQNSLTANGVVIPAVAAFNVSPLVVKTMINGTVDMTAITTGNNAIFGLTDIAGAVTMTAATSNSLNVDGLAIAALKTPASLLVDQVIVSGTNDVVKSTIGGAVAMNATSGWNVLDLNVADVTAGGVAMTAELANTLNVTGAAFAEVTADAGSKNAGTVLAAAKNVTSDITGDVTMTTLKDSNSAKADIAKITGNLGLTAELNNTVVITDSSVTGSVTTTASTGWNDVTIDPSTIGGAVTMKAGTNNNLNVDGQAVAAVVTPVIPDILVDQVLVSGSDVAKSTIGGKVDMTAIAGWNILDLNMADVTAGGVAMTAELSNTLNVTGAAFAEVTAAAGFKNAGAVLAAAKNVTSDITGDVGMISATGSNSANLSIASISGGLTMTAEGKGLVPAGDNTLRLDAATIGAGAIMTASKGSNDARAVNASAITGNLGLTAEINNTIVITDSSVTGSVTTTAITGWNDVTVDRVSTIGGAVTMQSGTSNGLWVEGLAIAAVKTPVIPDILVDQVLVSGSDVAKSTIGGKIDMTATTTNLLDLDMADVAAGGIAMTAELANTLNVTGAALAEVTADAGFKNAGAVLAAAKNVTSDITGDVIISSVTDSNSATLSIASISGGLTMTAQGNGVVPAGDNTLRLDAASIGAGASMTSLKGSNDARTVNASAITGNLDLTAEINNTVVITDSSVTGSVATTASTGSNDLTIDPSTIGGAVTMKAGTNNNLNVDGQAVAAVKTPVIPDILVDQVLVSGSDVAKSTIGGKVDMTATAGWNILDLNMADVTAGGVAMTAELSNTLNVFGAALAEVTADAGFKNAGAVLAAAKTVTSDITGDVSMSSVTDSNRVFLNIASISGGLTMTAQGKGLVPAGDNTLQLYNSTVGAALTSGNGVDMNAVAGNNYVDTLNATITRDLVLTAGGDNTGFSPNGVWITNSTITGSIIANAGGSNTITIDPSTVGGAVTMTAATSNSLNVDGQAVAAVKTPVIPDILVDQTIVAGTNDVVKSTIGSAVTMTATAGWNILDLNKADVTAGGVTMTAAASNTLHVTGEVFAAVTADAGFKNAGAVIAAAKVVTSDITGAVSMTAAAGSNDLQLTAGTVSGGVTMTAADTFTSTVVIDENSSVSGGVTLLGAAAGSLKIDGAVTGNVTTSTGADTLTVSGSVLGDIDTGAGIDSLTVSGLAGNISMGADADTLTLNVGNANVGSIDMGTGANTVNLNAGFDLSDIASAGDLDINAAGQALTVTNHIGSSAKTTVASAASLTFDKANASVSGSMVTAAVGAGNVFDARTLTNGQTLVSAAAATTWDILSDAVAGVELDMSVEGNHLMAVGDAVNLVSGISLNLDNWDHAGTIGITLSNGTAGTLSWDAADLRYEGVCGTQTWALDDNAGKNALTLARIA